MLDLASWRKFDWLMILMVVVLVAVGLAAIYSVDLSRGDQLDFFYTQLLAIVIGTIALFVAGSAHLSVYRSYASVIYLFSLLLLVLVIFVGISLRGTTGWFKFGPITFQPSEFAKVGLALYLSRLISRYGRRFDSLRFIVSSGLIAFLPICLIMLQPDLGSASVLFFVWLGFLFVLKTKKRYLIGLVAAIVLIAFVSFIFFLADYQKDRLLTFVNPNRDPLGSGYNINQSIIAVGSGGILGRGLGAGSQSQLHFLPEAQTDFIFSVIAEELGFVGTSVVLIAFFILLWRLLRLAKLSSSEFGTYLVLAITFLFFAQLVFNIGGALGLLPITGVTLPFISNGGSSMVISLLFIGIAQSVAHSAAGRSHSAHS